MEEKMAIRVNFKVKGRAGPRKGVLPGSDEEFLWRAKRGDEESFSRFHERHRRKVLNYLYRFTGNRAGAEDLTQETFLRAARGLAHYRPAGSAAGWLYRIARNVGLNSVRDSKNARGEFSLDEPIQAEEGEMDRQEILPGREALPDEEALRREREEQIQRGLLKVPPLHREVLILCDMERRSYGEAAKMLGCPINTVASRLSRARAQLARVLGYLKEDR